MSSLPRTLIVTPAGRRALRTIHKGHVVAIEPARHRLCSDCGQTAPHRRIIHQHGQNNIGLIVCNQCGRP